MTHFATRRPAKLDFSVVSWKQPGRAFGWASEGTRPFAVRAALGCAFDDALQVRQHLF